MMKEKRLSMDELKQEGKKLPAGETMEVRVDGVVMVVSKDSLWRLGCRFGTLEVDLIVVQRKN